MGERRVEPGGDPVASYDGGALALADGLMFAIDVCLSDLDVGQVLEVVSTNPALPHELPAWCRGTGHELVGSEPDGDAIRFHIRRGDRGAL
ncbi:MAG: sulfurtransferase TusA family protein, partial [Actinomycetota bacterium]